MRRLGAIIFVGLAALSLHAPAAFAAQPPGNNPYPPGKPPNNLGSKPHGSTFVVTSCGFKINTLVWVYFNDVFVENDTTNSSGCSQETVVVSCSGPTVTIDGHAMPAKNGSNDLTVGGPKPNGQVNSVTTRFEVSGCGNGKKFSASAGSLAFSDAVAYADAGQSTGGAGSVRGSAGGAGAVSAPSSHGVLAFTGHNWIRVTGVALFLIVMGLLIVLRQRREERREF